MPEYLSTARVVTRDGETDVMVLKAETASGELAATLRAVTKLGGNVELLPIRTLSQ
jgi:phenylacetate-CoA ligase